MSITLFISAGALSGQLISFDEWLDRWTREVAAANEALGRGFREGLTPDQAGEDKGLLSKPLGFLHLRDALLYTGNHELPVNLWRGRFSEIDGWMSGGYDRS